MPKITETTKANIVTAVAITLTVVAVLAAAVAGVALAVIFPPGLVVLGIGAGITAYLIVAGAATLFLGTTAGAIALFVKAHGLRQKAAHIPPMASYKATAVAATSSKGASTAAQLRSSLSLSTSTSNGSPAAPVVSQPLPPAAPPVSGAKNQAATARREARQNREACLQKNRKACIQQLNQYKGCLDNKVFEEVAAKSKAVDHTEASVKTFLSEIKAALVNRNQEICLEQLNQYKGFLDNQVFEEVAAKSKAVDHTEASVKTFLSEIKAALVNRNQEICLEQLNQYKGFLDNQVFEEVAAKSKAVDHTEASVKTFLSEIKAALVNRVGETDQLLKEATLKEQEHQNKMALFAFTVYPNATDETDESIGIKVADFEKLSYELAKKAVLAIIDREFAAGQQIVAEVKQFVNRDKLSVEEAYKLAAQLWIGGTSGKNSSTTVHMYVTTSFEKTVKSNYTNYSNRAKQFFHVKDQDFKGELSVAQAKYQILSNIVTNFSEIKKDLPKLPPLQPVPLSTNTFATMAVIDTNSNSSLSAVAAIVDTISVPVTFTDDPTPTITATVTTTPVFPVVIVDVSTSTPTITATITLSTPPPVVAATILPQPAPATSVGKITIEELKFSFSNMDSNGKETVRKGIQGLLDLFFPSELATGATQGLVNAIFAKGGMIVESVPSQEIAKPKPSLVMPLLRLIFPIFNSTKSSFEKNQQSLFDPETRKEAIKTIGSALKEVLTAKGDTGDALRVTLKESSLERPAGLGAFQVALKFAGMIMSNEKIAELINRYFPVDNILTKFKTEAAPFLIPVLPLINNLITRIVPVIGIKGVKELLTLVDSYYTMATKGCGEKEVEAFIKELQQFMVKTLDKIDVSKEKSLFINLWDIAKGFIEKEMNGIAALLLQKDADAKKELKTLATKSVGEAFGKIGLECEINIPDEEPLKV